MVVDKGTVGAHRVSAEYQEVGSDLKQESLSSHRYRVWGITDCKYLHQC